MRPAITCTVGLVGHDFFMREGERVGLSQVGSAPSTGPAPLDPFENAIGKPPQERHVLGKQNQPKRQHPQPEEGQYAQQATDYQERADSYPQPALRRLP